MYSGAGGGDDHPKAPMWINPGHVFHAYQDQDQDRDLNPKGPPTGPGPISGSRGPLFSRCGAGTVLRETATPRIRRNGERGGFGEIWKKKMRKTRFRRPTPHVES